MIQLILTPLQLANLIMTDQTGMLNCTMWLIVISQQAGGFKYLQTSTQPLLPILHM